MADRVTVNGVPTWYDEQGAGDPVVLLHGGFTDSRDFAGNLAGLADRHRLFLPERRGHGHTADVPGPYTMAALADDTAEFLTEVVGGPAHLVGYSAGASVALRTALRRPELVDRLVLVSGSFHRDGMIVLPQPDAPLPPPLADAYAEVSPDGAEHLPVVVAKVAQAVADDPGLDPGDLATLTCPTMVMTADDDIVTLEHSVALYRALPQAQLAVVPGSSHLLLHERPAWCTGLVAEFLAGGGPAPMMPIRRAAAPPHRPAPADPAPG